MEINTYKKTKDYEEKNKLNAEKMYSDDISFFISLYDQNLDITEWMSSSKKVDSSRSAFSLNLLHKALRFLYACHDLILRGQLNEANVLLRNVVECLLEAVDIKTHERAWSEIINGKYLFQSCFERIKKDDNLQRYNWLTSEHGKLSSFWSHENPKTIRINSVPIRYKTGETEVKQKIKVGYSYTDFHVFLCFADVVKFTREITQTIDFLFGQLLQKERSGEWLLTKKKFEEFLKKEEDFKKRHNWKD